MESDVFHHFMIFADEIGIIMLKNIIKVVNVLEKLHTNRKLMYAAIIDAITINMFSKIDMRFLYYIKTTFNYFQ